MSEGVHFIGRPRKDRGAVYEFAITSCVADDLCAPNRTSDLEEARSSFVHARRTAVKHRSIQCRNSALDFPRLRHLHQGYASRFSPIPVRDDRDGFEGSVGCQKFPQLLLRQRDIQVPDENVSHDSIIFLIFPNFCNRERTRNFTGDFDADRLSQARAHSEGP